MIRRTIASAVAALLAAVAPAVAGTPENRARIAAGDVAVEITMVASDVMRVRVAPPSVLDGPDTSYAIVPDRAAPIPFTRSHLRNGSMDVEKISGPEISAQVTLREGHSPAITITDAADQVIVDDDPIRGMTWDKDTGAASVSKVHPRDELIYGFGEKALGLEHSSESVAYWNSDTPGYRTGTDPIYQTVPFYIANRRGAAYGVFFDNTYRSWFDVAKRDPDRIAFGAAGGWLDYYVFAGGKERDARKVIQRYTELTGRSALPPLWALGYQQCRWSYSPERRVREIAARFRETSTPCDAIYLDIDYMDGYRVFTWSPQSFPDPAKLVGDLARGGFHTVVIIDPGIKVDPAYAAYQSGKAGGHFVTMADGSEFQGSVWPGICAFPDFTNPMTRAWWGEQFAGLVKTGVAGFWTDMNEPSVFLRDGSGEIWSMHHPMKTFPMDTRHAGDGQPGSHARYHNVYGQQMARATMEGVRKLAPDRRPFVLTRATYAGGQRYSASWTGDNIATWEHLGLSIPMLLNMGLSGQTLVGADIGGFIDAPTPELYARWLQAAALTPVMRSHTVKDSPDQEPFAYGPEFTKINRATIELRYQLMPTLYSLFAESARTGEPVMRPLWLDHPKDTGTYFVDDEYMVGRDLLVAPVVREGAASRGVYLPAGSAWIDWYTGERFDGGKSIEVKAPIDRLPLFVRAGAIVAVRPVAQYTTAQLALAITLRVFPGGDGEFTLYEDAGDGYGPSVRTRLRNRSGIVAIESVEGAFGPSMLQLPTVH